MKQPAKKKQYIETFDEGPGGWFCFDREHANGPVSPEISKGAIVSRSPWWVDPNHAPPGAGYLHLLFVLYMVRALADLKEIRRVSWPNRFVEGGYPTDLRNAKLHLRIRGEVDLRGAQLVLLAQSDISKDPGHPNWVNQVLSSQPVKITPKWSQQTLCLTTDPRKWTPLGGRHDSVGFYGKGPIEEVLRNMNGDIIFVLFPLDVVPSQPIEGDPHILSAYTDYKPDRSRLPEGYVMMDEVRIEYP